MLVRPAATADLSTLIPLCEGAIAAGEVGPWSAAGLGMWLAMVRDTPERTLVAVRDNTVVGAITPHWEALIVAPDSRRQGVGRALVAAAAATDDLVLTPPVDAPAAGAFLRSCGFGFSHTLVRMRLNPEAPTLAPGLAAGWSIQPYDRTRVHAYVALINTVFADLSSPLSLDVEHVIRAQGKPDFDPGSIAILIRDDDPGVLRGFCRAIPSEDEHGQPVGEITLVGVSRDARGLGNGRALVRWAIAHLRATGFPHVQLEVEEANTAAHALYLAEGFVPVSRASSWIRRAARD
jgi:mycothiol synthase